MKIGILRETKNPPDKRVPFTPKQCRRLLIENADLKIQVQPSDYRCFSDEEYLDQGITMGEDLSDCDLLMGVKEVKIPMLVPNKKYMFFSHTAKEQPYNQPLLKAVSEKGITLLDYEYLTRPDKTRVVAFGRWAGIVGAYNGLMALGIRSKKYTLPRAKKLSGFMAMQELLKKINPGNVKIVLTGGGRVAGGAVEVLQAAEIKEVSPMSFLNDTFDEAVFCRLDPWHYAEHKDGKTFDFKHFVEHPSEYKNTFVPYAEQADVFMACHFWDPESPVMLTNDDLKKESVHLQVIADISCDIDGPIASTIRPSTIAVPLYGYSPSMKEESEDVFADDVITVMAVDNLPGELPRDASESFGNALIENVIPALLGDDEQGIVKRSMITENGELTENFSYLEGYLNF